MRGFVQAPGSVYMGGMGGAVFKALPLGAGVFLPLLLGRRMRRQTLTRLQKLEALLLPSAELERPPLEVITTIEDENGNIIEGAEKLPGGKDYKPGGQKLYLHIVKTPERADNEGKK